MLDKVGLRVAGTNQQTKIGQTQNSYTANLLSKTPTAADKVDISRSNKVISFTGHNFEYKQNRNVIHLISFTANDNFKKNQPLGIQMRISGVQGNQSNKIEDPDAPKKPEIIEQKPKPRVDKHGIPILDAPNPRYDKNAKGSINKLAESNWTDGKTLMIGREEKAVTRKILLSEPGEEPCYEERQYLTRDIADPSHGVVGYIPVEIYPHLQPFLDDPKIVNDFRINLSNVIAGMSKGAPTIGLRANLLYVGKDPEIKTEVEKTFNEVLNDPDCSEKAMLYQPETAPDEVLKLILNHEKEAAVKAYEDKYRKENDLSLNDEIPLAEKQKAQVLGDASIEKMNKAINNILKEIEDPENKNILVVGHCKPDGDALGSVLGFKNSVSLKYPDKNIDCAVDDKIPGLFRHNIPGIDGEVKRPINEERVGEIDKAIQSIEGQKQDFVTKAELEMLKEEREEVQNPENQLRPKAPYDVVVMFDVPTPERFTGAFKKYMLDEKGQPLKNAEGKEVKVIYIDHHPHRINEWKDAKEKTGIDMEKIHKNGLSWIADAVPAATQLVGILAAKMMPELNDIGNDGKKARSVFKTSDQQNKFKAFVASLVTGMSTDTGSFLRTANLLPEDMKKPAQQRPNFMPEGMSKWLMAMTKGMPKTYDKDNKELGNISKKWLRENINYDIEDKRVDKLSLTARETMLKASMKGMSIESTPELGALGVGIVQVDYDQMFDVWNLSRYTEKQKQQEKIKELEKQPEKAKELEKIKRRNSETTFLDVQNSFKYSEIMGAFRGDPSKHNDKNVSTEMTPTESKAKELSTYASKFDNKRVAVLICQDKKAGFLDEKLKIADQNGLRLSLRSQDGTIHAELIANLFGGGGHGGASGGRVDLPGVTLATPLAVEINGKKAENMQEVYEQLKENHEIMNNPNLSEKKQTEQYKKVKVVLDDKGKCCAALIKDLTVEMRKDDLIKQEAEKQAAKEKHKEPIDAGLISLQRQVNEAERLYRLPNNPFKPKRNKNKKSA